MIATERHLVEITQEEHIHLIHNCRSVLTTLGPCVRLIWEKGEEMPEAWRVLGLMRGVLNENLEGAGI